MKLIEPLSAGVRGAESGTVKIFSRSTTTKAQCYSAFEGGVLSQPETGFVLDANGGLEVYVDEVVDVQVMDASGIVMRSFTAGETASSSELRSLSFTGTDYDTGISAAGSPLTLKQMADLWIASAGAVDFKVLSNGSAVKLSSAIAALAGFFVSAKSPDYGAVGDGVSDDTTPIQNALNSGAGNVLLPAGTYRVTSALAVPVDVNLIGVGAGKTIIKIDHATNHLLQYGTGSSAGWQVLSDISLDAAQPHSGHLIDFANAGARRVRIERCAINTLGVSTGECVSATTAAVHEVGFIDSTVIQPTGAIAVNAYNAGGSNTYVYGLRSTFVCPGATAAVKGRYLRMSQCVFSAQKAIVADGGGATASRTIVSGCEFLPSTGTAVALTLANGNVAETDFIEAGNIFTGTFGAWYSGLVAGTNNPRILLLSRIARVKSVTDNSATYNFEADQYETIVLTRTNNAAQALTANVGPPGAEFTMVVVNNSGGASGTFTPGTGFQTGTPTFTTIANTKLEVWKFKMVVSGGGASWVPQAASVHSL